MKVFISHSQEDAAVAPRIAEGLRNWGLEGWVAEMEIMPGDNFALKIAQALDDSQAMIVVITSNTMRSSQVAWEVGYALGHQNYSGRLIPVVAGSEGDVDLSEVPGILRQLHPVMLTIGAAEDEGIRQIAAALRKAS